MQFDCRTVATSVLAVIAVAALIGAPAWAAGASPFGTTVREQVGVNIHFTTALPGEMDMLSAAGFGLIRMDVTWADTEKHQGVYDFRAYDHLLSDLDSHHIRALWILCYGNPNYDTGLPPESESAQAAFVRWAAAAVTHFKGHHIMWEMWNEPNRAGKELGDRPYDPVTGGSWTDDYIKLALATGRAIRTAAPGETYIGPAESGTYPPFLESCFKGGLLQYWRGVSVHPYREGPPETAAPDYDAIRTLIAKYEPAGANISILSGEWGYGVVPGVTANQDVPSDAVQADYFDREILTNMRDGVPLSIWYDWRNDGDDSENNQDNFGLVRHDYHPGRTPVFDPKPSYVAARTLLTTLGTYRYSRVIPVDGSPDALLFSFARKKDHRYAAYTTAMGPENVTLPIPFGRYSVIDISGNVERVADAGADGLALTLTGDVQFVVPSK